MTTIHAIGSETVDLDKAILLYRGGTRSHRYASIHDVTLEDGAPVICEGEPLTMGALRASLEDIAVAQGAKTLVWASPYTVATGPGITAWWTPAQKRWMHFDEGDWKMHMPARQPPLMWVTVYGELYVFALNKDERPTPDTPLFNAPYYNVWRDGRVCQGSMSVQDLAEPREWEDAFYAATFTHPNDRGTLTLTTYRGGARALWTSLMKTGKKAFPIEHLVPRKHTAGEVLAQLGANRE